MAWQGGWAAQRGWYVDPSEPLHVAGADHVAPVPGDATVGAWGAPPGTDTPAAETPYIIDPEAVGDWVVDGGGQWFDQTPTSHEEGYGSENYVERVTWPGEGAPGDVAQAQASAAAHGRDFGAARQGTYPLDRPFQAYDERYLGTAVEGVGPIELPQLVGGGMRGLNSYGVNNPPLEMYGGQGYRRGWTRDVWVDRKMYDPERVHDGRILTPNLAYAEVKGQPVPADPGPYNSPFDSLARIIDNIAQRPQMRREPPPVDQSLMDDGSAQPVADAPVPDWVVG